MFRELTPSPSSGCAGGLVELNQQHPEHRDGVSPWNIGKTFTSWWGYLSEVISLTVCGYQQFGWANWESRGYVTGFVSPGILYCAVYCSCRWKMLRNYKRWHILRVCGRWKKVREIWDWADSSHRCKMSSMFRTAIVLKGGWSGVLEKG